MTDAPDLPATRKRLRELLAKATPGPWAWDENGSFLWGPNGQMVMDRPNVNPDQYDTFALRMRGFGGKLPIPTNAALVGDGLSTLPALLDRIDELEAQLEERLGIERDIRKQESRHTDIVSDYEKSLSNRDARIRELEAAVREAVCRDDQSYASCPWCENWDGQGHQSDCIKSTLPPEEPK